MIGMIDNYDSFTYNLVQYLGTLGAEIEVYRNDAITVEALAARPLEGLVISPGPGVPKAAGITEPAIAALAGRVPVLGVCLGHQGLAEVYGGRVVRAPRLTGSSSSMISIARTFGAPDRVPAGNVARNRSSQSRPARSLPVTWDTMCMTCE